MEIAVLRGHEGRLSTATFSPDGRRILTASHDGTVQLWPHYGSMDELYEHARDVVDHLQPLTDEEACAYQLRIEGCEP